MILVEIIELIINIDRMLHFLGNLKHSANEFLRIRQRNINILEQKKKRRKNQCIWTGLTVKVLMQVLFDLLFLIYAILS